MSKNVLILGSTGYIGKKFKHLADKKKTFNIFCPSRDELDILNSIYLLSYLQCNKIDAIINFTGKRLSNKENVKDFVATNTIGIQNIIDCCESLNIKLINISSYAILDYVKTECPEEDIYKSLKLFVEALIKTSKCQYLSFILPTIIDKIMPKDMLVYRMTFDESFKLTNKDKYYYYQKMDFTVKFLYNHILPFLSIDKHSFHLIVPCEIQTLESLFALCKENKFGLKR